LNIVLRIDDKLPINIQAIGVAHHHSITLYVLQQSQMEVDNNQKIIILISGWKGSGKDTMFEYLKQKYGFERFAFADDLKDMSALPYALERNDMDDPVLKETPILCYPVISKDSYSALVQNELYTHFSTFHGQKPGKDDKPVRDESGNLLFNGEQLFWTPRAILILEGSTKRSVYPDFWADKSKKMFCISKIAITDCRYESEIERVKKLFKGYIVIVVRVDVDGEPTSKDASERALDNYPGFYARILNEHKGVNSYYNDIERALFVILHDM
jgi:hypothetical protein